MFLAMCILMSQLFSNPAIFELPQNPHVHEQINEQGKSISFEHTHIQIHEPIFLNTSRNIFYDNPRLAILPSLEDQPHSIIHNSIFRPPIS